MMRSTISRKEKLKKMGSGLAVALFWLTVWQLAYWAVAQEIMLVSPVQTLLRLFSLAKELSFWKSIGLTCLRVLTGFLAALLVGALLAALCARFALLRRLTAPLMGMIRATPVASFIILVLVWIATDRIPAFIAFLVVTPIVWGNLTAGLESVDGDLLEMAAVFRFSRRKILRYIYLPAEMPHFVSACTAGLGLAWKSAVAAEVIALPKMAVGRQIHNSKIYLETADLFAWTLVVILLSFLIEKLAVKGLVRLSSRLSGPAHGEGGDENAADSP